MKSKSRLPKFAPLPHTGPIVQTDPRVWKPELNGLPCWFKPFRKGLLITPFYTARALSEAAFEKVEVHEKLDISACTILELRSRENPWHHSGRLERLVVRRDYAPGKGDVFTLKFNGDGEQIECTGVRAAGPVQQLSHGSKYKGPRATNDTKSAVSVNGKRS